MLPGNVERPVVSLRTVIIAVGAAQFMLPFMLSGAGPLLPAIGRDLHASAMQLSLINAAYTLSLAIFHLDAGRVGDMVGRKRLFSAACRCSSSCRPCCRS